MKKTVAILAVLSLAALAGKVAVSVPVPAPDSGKDDWLHYDDGTAAWFTWDGMYRGTWFDAEDFSSPGYNIIYQTEIWFYHHSSYPWDTSQVYIELWTGESAAPVTRLDRTEVTALHFAPVYAVYYPAIWYQQDFWALANTEMSSGGWPSILGDGTPGTHSFYSDDFVIWEPWGDMGDYFVRVHADLVSALDNTTWGSIKAVFL